LGNHECTHASVVVVVVVGCELKQQKTQKLRKRLWKKAFAMESRERRSKKKIKTVAMATTLVVMVAKTCA